MVSHRWPAWMMALAGDGLAPLAGVDDGAHRCVVAVGEAPRVVTADERELAGVELEGSVRMVDVQG